MADKQKSIFL